MYQILSKWAGDVTSACFRCGITKAELASASGVSRQFLSKFMHMDSPNWDQSRQKIERGLRSCVEKRGVRFEDFFPTEERPG